MVFKPGQSGNPSGKPKERIWRDAILAAARNSNSEGDLKLALRDLAEKLIEAAKDKDVVALKEIGNRLDGTPEASVSVEHTGSVAHQHEGIPYTAEWLGNALGKGPAEPLTKPVLN